MSAATVLVLTLQIAGFSGVWERDPDQSDDAQAKMQAAFEQMRSQRQGRRGPGGGPPPGGPPPEGREPGRGGLRGPVSLGTAADELSIEHEGGELRVDDGEQLRIYYLDGEEHKRQMPNGVELETTARLVGNAVSIEEKMERGEILRKFEIGPDGETLVLTSTVKLPGMKDPVVIRSVYERVEDGGVCDEASHIRSWPSAM